MTDSFYGASGTSPPEASTTADCTTCKGRGEVPVPGTYGPAISPEALELRECPRCEGSGETSEVCLTCGLPIPADINGWPGGHNPWPLNDDPALSDRRVCSDCNALYVIPARLGHPVEGTFYDTDGEVLGTFGTEQPEPVSEVSA